jgi:hypothetical protein
MSAVANDRVPLGKIAEDQRAEFARFVDGRFELYFGSMSADGTRRLQCQSSQVTLARKLYSEFTGIDLEETSYNTVIHEPDGWGDKIAKGLEFFGITKERYSRWLGAPCNCEERQKKINAVGEWVNNWLSGGQKADIKPPVPPERVLVGSIHDGTLAAFKRKISELGIPGVVYGYHANHLCHRRVIDTLGHFDRLKQLVHEWNGGDSNPKNQMPFIPGTWTCGMTTIPDRANNPFYTKSSLLSLAAGGFNKITLYVDGYLDRDSLFSRSNSPQQNASDSSLMSSWECFRDLVPDVSIKSRHSFASDDQSCTVRLNDDKLQQVLAVVKQYPRMGTVFHWHRTLLDMYSADPWSEYYAVFQDDIRCVKGLKDYILFSQIPQNSYINLLTFMENEEIIHDRQPGWMEAYRGKSGYQRGRGAIALVFRHHVVEMLLSSRRFITRRHDAQLGNVALDGAVLGALAECSVSEFIHNPSLTQHVGIESSMGNPWNSNESDTRYAHAKSFPGECYNVYRSLPHSGPII